jgi:hypothetical protein
MDYAWHEYIPYGFTRRKPEGTVAQGNPSFDVEEIVFDRELTDNERDAVNQSINDPAVIDWRDDQTLWIWASEQDLKMRSSVT